MSSYQKLREENESLKIKFEAMKERLFEVCLRPTSEKTMLIVRGIKVVEGIQQAKKERYVR